MVPTTSTLVHAIDAICSRSRSRPFFRTPRGEKPAASLANQQLQADTWFCSVFSSSQSLTRHATEIRITPEQQTLYRNIVAAACHVEDLQTTVWKKQTDVLKQVHIIAALVATFGERAVFVDGRIDERLTQQAVESGNIKGFFNSLFHRKRIDWQRIIYFDTTSKRRSGPSRRGKMNLHFHALFILPQKQSNDQMRATLMQVFGKAGTMRGEVQFKFVKPDWSKGYTFNGVKAKGPIGKLLYVQHGMGGTYNDLELNDNGKRSRKAPIERLRCNRQASGLAKGIPSNFNAKATLVDHVSTEAGHKAFTWWLKVHHEELKEVKRRQARTAPPVRTKQPLDRKRKLRR